VNERQRILVVDDQQSARDFLSRCLAGGGYDVAQAASVDEAEQQLAQHPFHLVITDLRMPGASGLEGIERFKAIDPQMPVIMVTAYATVETAVHAMKLGAVDYLRKPFEAEELEILVARALEHRSLVEENRKLRAEVASRFKLENMIGRSPAMLRLFDLIRKVAPADVPVLITGESGTGKDLVARAVHGLSQRAQQTFLSVNCAAVPESLLESELFGHAKGAFTGAGRARRGYFREADGGTLFLDEIGDMSPGQQAKLLRALESGEMIPVGTEQPLQVDVRVVAATNASFEKLIEEGRFREDLLYRIDTVRLELPPLRDRREDIPLLVAHFLERAPHRPGATVPRLSAAAMRCLLAHDWPGNVRELEHAVEHAALVAESEEIDVGDLPPRVRASFATGRPTLRSHTGSFRAAKAEFERDYFVELLTRADGNITRAAAIAGLHRATLHERLKRLGIGSGDEKG